jgi:hypothetical protein
VSVASRYSVGGVGVYFINESYTSGGIISGLRSYNCRVRLYVFRTDSNILTQSPCQSSEDVDELFNRVTPYGETSLGGFFKKATKDPLKKIRQGGSEPCKFNYLVITDGQPGEPSQPMASEAHSCVANR